MVASVLFLINWERFLGPEYEKRHNNDRQTVTRILEGDFTAFEGLVEKYQGRLFRHLRKMVRDNQVAEDLLQDTLLNAHRGLKGFTGNSSLSTWLFKIATNNALMFLRKRRPECIEYVDEIKGDLDYPFLTASPEFANSPLEILLSREGREKIEQAIESLPLIYRTVMVLRDVEGFSLQEVSEITDASISAVKSRLHRARSAVRATLESYYMEKGLSS
jgi:RNA polymerase sigma-70 factor (ECF subfamily)